MLKHLNGLLCLQFKWNEWLLDYDEITLRKKCPYSELFWSAFSCIRAEYGEIRSISPYSVQMRENADQYNSEYGHFLRSISPYSVQKRENADQNNSEHGHFLRSISPYSVQMWGNAEHADKFYAVWYCGFKSFLSLSNIALLFPLYVGCPPTVFKFLLDFLKLALFLSFDILQDNIYFNKVF